MQKQLYWFRLQAHLGQFPHSKSGQQQMTRGCKNRARRYKSKSPSHLRIRLPELEILEVFVFNNPWWFFLTWICLVTFSTNPSVQLLSSNEFLSSLFKEVAACLFWTCHQQVSFHARTACIRRHKEQCPVLTFPTAHTLLCLSQFHPQSFICRVEMQLPSLPLSLGTHCTN